MNKVIRQVIVIFAIFYGVMFYCYFQGIIGAERLHASVYSGVINVVNLMLSVTAFNYAIRKSNKTFMLYNLGGMMLRLMVLVIVLVIFLKFLNIDKYGFIFTFFILYVVSLILEINYFRLKVQEKNNKIC